MGRVRARDGGCGYIIYLYWINMSRLGHVSSIDSKYMDVSLLTIEKGRSYRAGRLRTIRCWRLLGSCWTIARWHWMNSFWLLARIRPIRERLASIPCWSDADKYLPSYTHFRQDTNGVAAPHRLGAFPFFSLSIHKRKYLYIFFLRCKRSGKEEEDEKVLKIKKKALFSQHAVFTRSAGEFSFFSQGAAAVGLNSLYFLVEQYL